MQTNVRPYNVKESEKKCLCGAILCFLVILKRPQLLCFNFWVNCPFKLAGICMLFTATRPALCNAQFLLSSRRTRAATERRYNAHHTLITVTLSFLWRPKCWIHRDRLITHDNKARSSLGWYFIRSHLWLNQYWLDTSALSAVDMSQQPFSSSQLLKALKKINWPWFAPPLIDSRVCCLSGRLRAFLLISTIFVDGFGGCEREMAGGHCITVLILGLYAALIEKIKRPCNSGVLLSFCSAPAEIPETSIKLLCPWLSPAKFSFWIWLQGLRHSG